MDAEQPTRSEQAGRFKDARGRPIALVDPYVLHKLGQHDVIPAETLAKIAREIGSGWARIGRLLFFTIWPVCLVLLTIAHLAKQGGILAVNPRELRLWAVLAILFAVNVVIVWFIARAVRLKRVCQAMLRHCRCPCCGYDLRFLPTDPTDGATVCPECGCAWHLEPLPPQAQ